MLMQHNLLPKHKHRKNGLNVNIDLYELATELYNELDALGIIERTRKIPQLGLIRVTRNLSKTRYDYIMLQLYFHQLIKPNLSPVLKLSYNNYLSQNDFLQDNRFIRCFDIVFKHCGTHRCRSRLYRYPLKIARRIKRNILH